MMELALINSPFTRAGMDFEEGIRHTKEIGYDAVEVVTEAWRISDAERDRIRRVCDRHELPVVSLPVYSLGIADFNEAVRRFHVERTKAFVDLARDVGARNVFYVLGEYLWQKEVIPPEAQWNWAVKETQEIGRYAQDNGVEIVVGLEPFRLSIIHNVEKMLCFIEEVDSPMVYAGIDVSHVVLAGDPPAALADLRGLARHVHLSDCDGKVHGDLPPGRGVVDFPPYLEAIRDLKIEGAVSVELEGPQESESVVDWVAEAYDSAAKLMADAGLRP